MTAAFYNGDQKMFLFLYKELKEARKIWRKNIHQPLHVLRFGIMEQMMRMRMPPKIVRWVENFKF